jgi:DNA-directed RNA polymerase III subunit RPC8
MDIGSPVKFRVSGELFEESCPIGPPVSESQPSTSSTAATEAKIPYKIIAAINEAGLGLLSWWDTQSSEAKDDDEEGLAEDQEVGEDEVYDE